MADKKEKRYVSDNARLATQGRYNMKRSLSLFLVTILLFSVFIPVSALDEAIVYVRDGGNGDGSSKDSPVGTLEDAYRVLLDNTNIKSAPDAVGRIVICGKLTLSDHFNYNGLISHIGQVIYTSSYGEDFRKTAEARLLIHAESKFDLSVTDEHRFQLGGPTRFEDLIIDRGEGSAVSLTVYATTNLYISESVEVVNSNWRATYTEPIRALTENEVSSILLSAHRGYQPMGPENSILSFEAAGKLGFDYIETDVIMTRDGTLVCIHDSTLDRTTNGSGKVTQMTYSSIRRYSIDTAAYGFDISSAAKDKLYIPTFREYLEICKKHGAKPFIEIKDSREEVIRKVINTALEYFPAKDIVMSCGSLSVLETSYAYNRDIFHHLIWGDQTDAGYENSIKTLSKMTNSSGKVNAGIAFNIKNLTEQANYDRAMSWIDKAHAASLLTCLRGADDMTEVRLMFELGIDYYPTNTTAPEKLAELRKGTDGGYSYSSAEGGKLFIRGGSRHKVTKDDISITVLGGMYDFIAPSNAEAESTGNYNVTVGGNAFVSRLVAGETAKNANGDRAHSLVTVKDNAVINDLFIAGDSSITNAVTVELEGGRTVNISEGRKKGGSAEEFNLIIHAASLMPSNIIISDETVITGKKTLTFYSEEPDSTVGWDEIIILTATGTTITEETDVPCVPDTADKNDSMSTNNDIVKPQTPLIPIITTFSIALIAFLALWIAKRAKSGCGAIVSALPGNNGSHRRR